MLTVRSVSHRDAAAPVLSADFELARDQHCAVVGAPVDRLLCRC
jgi:hypothetical protein